MDESTFLEMIANVIVTFSSNILDAFLRMRIFTRWTITTFVLILWISSFSVVVYYVEYDLDPCIHGGCDNLAVIDSPPHARKGGIRKSLRAISSLTKRRASRRIIQNKIIQPSLRKLSDTNNPIYFLHIGKTGGSSVDKMMKHLCKTMRTRKRYWGFNHFDWSYIEMDYERKKNHNHSPRSGTVQVPADVARSVDVITFLRNPISRSISQFHFGKTLQWAKNANARFLHQSLEEYIHDEEKTWTQPLNDGEGGVAFLTGIFHNGGWVMTDEIESEQKEYLRQNQTAACLLAAERLEQTVWFGLLEDIDRSMKLLEVSFDLDYTPSMPTRNTAKQKYPDPSEEIKQEIEHYIPQDIWLYEFAKRLFEARWNYVMHVDGQQEYVPPELPPFNHFHKREEEREKKGR